MAEENDEKITKWAKIVEYLSKITLFTMKNEANALKGTDNIRDVHITVNVNVGDKTYNSPVTFPANTKPRDVAKVLEGWEHVDPPKLGKIDLDENDEKWIEDSLTTVVNSSAATLSTVASFDKITLTEEVNVELDPTNGTWASTVPDNSDDDPIDST